MTTPNQDISPWAHDELPLFEVIQSMFVDPRLLWITGPAWCHVQATTGLTDVRKSWPYQNNQLTGHAVIMTLCETLLECMITSPTAQTITKTLDMREPHAIDELTKIINSIRQK